MKKTILLTGATDGIGLEAAKLLAAEGHKVLLHGRNAAKLASAAEAIGGDNEVVSADLADLNAVAAMADDITSRHNRLDVLINNAGVLKASETKTQSGLDIRFVVNTLAPFLLARRLLPIIPEDGRIINLSSAAQAPVQLAAMAAGAPMADMEAYAQSKLAITMWSRVLAGQLGRGPLVVSVNPGSLLATKMVKEGFGIAGNDISIGAEILRRAALDADFSDASGLYYDNDAGGFGPPHQDALDDNLAKSVTDALEKLLPA
ncbi:MAG: SDR family NAD(P)-dependent oxidoreductase [Pseudomonadota bacterium]